VWVREMSNSEPLMRCRNIWDGVKTGVLRQPQDKSRGSLFIVWEASYIPKEEMVNITTYLTDILEAKHEKKHFWWRWRDRFSSKYDKWFGTDWKDREKDFWMELTLYSQRVL
jgi:hypothetical protein